MVTNMIKTIKQFEYETRPEEKVVVKMSTLSALKDEIRKLNELLEAKKEEVSFCKAQVNKLTGKLIEIDNYRYLDIKG